MKIRKHHKKGKLVLGINGWYERSHDASAVLVEIEDDNIDVLVAIEEDKVRGKKHLYDIFPCVATETILEMLGLEVKDIDQIAIGWDYPKMYDHKRQKIRSTKEILSGIFPKCKKELDIPVTFVPHHLAHASSVFRTSTFDEALVFVIDGNGEEEASSIWKNEKTELVKIAQFSPYSSFGFLFEAVNVMLGFYVNESGKTMGLAAYGEPVYFEKLLKYYGEDLEVSDLFKKMYLKVERFVNKDVISHWQEAVRKTWLMIFKQELKLERLESKIESFYEFPEEYCNLASSVQKLLEYKVTKEINRWINKIGIKNVCMSGGVALNCTMNGKILSEKLVENVYVQPAAGDSGVALGAALEIANKICKRRMKKEFNPYLGVEYDDYEIEEYLKLHKIDYQIFEDASDIIADAIVSNKTVAIFQGRNEWGPRALGNRSIISHPIKGKLDYINQYIKIRECGRPLAPSILESEKNLLSSNVSVLGRYMNMAYQCEYMDDSVMSGVHVDGTYRAQFVNEELNEIYCKQLKKISEKKNNSMVINTSLNKLTPIVYDIRQAVELFYDSGLDYLVFNNKIVLSK